MMALPTQSGILYLNRRFLRLYPFDQEFERQSYTSLGPRGPFTSSGIWMNSETVWIGGRDDSFTKEAIWAYSLSTGARDSDKDIDISTDPTTPRTHSITSDGTTMWRSIHNSVEVEAYTLSTGARDSSKDFTFTGAAPSSGITTDGTYMYVRAYAQFTGNYVWVYDLSDGERVASKEVFGSTFGGNYFAITSDQLWIQNLNRVYSYNLSDGTIDINGATIPTTDSNGIFVYIHPDPENSFWSMTSTFFVPSSSSWSDASAFGIQSSAWSDADDLAIVDTSAWSGATEFNNITPDPDTTSEWSAAIDFEDFGHSAWSTAVGIDGIIISSDWSNGVILDDLIISSEWGNAFHFHNLEIESSDWTRASVFSSLAGTIPEDVAPTTPVSTVFGEDPSYVCAVVSNQVGVQIGSPHTYLDGYVEEEASRYSLVITSWNSAPVTINSMVTNPSLVFTDGTIVPLSEYPRTPIIVNLGDIDVRSHTDFVALTDVNGNRLESFSEQDPSSHFPFYTGYIFRNPA